MTALPESGCIVRADWRSIEVIPLLGPGELQVWRLDAAFPPAWCNLCGLTAEEQSHAATLRVPPVKAEFVAARCLLRRLLSRNTGLPACGLVVQTQKHGKPVLLDDPGLHFNVSHSRGLILIALSRSGPVGVDVEWMDASLDLSGGLLEIAADSLSSEEFTRVEQASSSQLRMDAFYRAWTRKEAAAKADGRGIAQKLNYSVYASMGRCRVDHADVGDRGCVTYLVDELPAGVEYRAALATRLRAPVDLFDASGLSQQP